MNKQKMIGALAFGFLAIFLAAAPAQATIFRMLNGRALGKAASTNGSMAFKAKVLKVEQTSDGQAITFQVQDALKGKVKNGETLTLQFPDMRFSNNMRLSAGIPPPQVSPGMEGVFFTTTRFDGKTFLIGGDQGQYYVTQEGGKSVVYNRLGNANFFEDMQLGSNPLMKKVVQGMQDRNSGTITYEDFKQLLNQ